MSEQTHPEQSDSLVRDSHYVACVLTDTGIGRQVIMATVGDAADIAAAELRRGARSVLIQRVGGSRS